MSRRVSLFLFAILWFWLAACAQGSAFWRDSGEFVIAARYLDVSHPGGFPLYGMLANLFALIPIGPIAFRVNLFSSATAALFLVLTAQNAALTVRLLKPNGSKFVEILAAIAPVTLFLSSESFFKQSLTAEVYLLNGLLLAGLYRVYLQWKLSSDLRWLIVLPFLAALTTGNHAASGIALLPAAVVVLAVERRSISKFLLPGLAAGLLGLLIYGYLPARANAHPPLNTGNPSSAHRFISQITDGRDRALRGESAKNDVAVIQSIPRFEQFRITAVSDLRKLAGELTWPLIIAGALGLLLLTASSPALGLLLAVTGLGTWFFFQGWDPDPWMPLFASLAIGCSALIAWTGARVGAVGCIAALGVIGGGGYRLYHSEIVPMASAIRDYEEPAAYAAAALRTIPPGSPLLAEPAWFFLKYARDIEGVGEDHAILYQPSILFPEFFTFPALRLPSKKYLLAPSGSSLEANTEFAGKLVSSLAPFGPIAIEAGILNQFLAKIARFKGHGTVVLENGVPGGLEEGFAPALLDSLRGSLSSDLSQIPATAGDARHFAELKAVTTADLLAQSGNAEEASHLLSGLCLPLQGTLCGEVALNNLGSYFLRVRKFDQSAEVLRYLLNRGTTQRSAVERNLAAAESGVKQAAQERE